MKAFDRNVPSTVQPRIELVEVPVGWAVAQWGAAHKRETDGPVVEYWLFELENGAIVVVEYMAAWDSIVVHSDSTDAQMLRSALGVLALIGADIRNALTSNEVRKLAGECRAAGRSVADAFAALEGSGADPMVILDSVRDAYGVSAEEVRDSFGRRYRSWAPFDLRAGPLRRG